MSLIIFTKIFFLHPPQKISYGTEEQERGAGEA